MPVALPDIDFGRIRPHGQPASRANAFEELASILIEQGVVDWPPHVRFFRFGNPDGGREGKGTLPGGEVWAWQVKYVFDFDASTAGQVSASVRRVLETEPRLTRYFVALPIDLPAGDTSDRKSAYKRWEEKVSEWEALAQAKGMVVEFVFVGAHQLITALTQPQHAGRARYWFEAQILTSGWQRRRVEEAHAKEGPRYSPELHVEVDVVRALDAVGRSESYVAQWQHVLARLRRARQWSWWAPAEKQQLFVAALADCASALDAADTAMDEMIAAVRTVDELPVIDDVLDEAIRTAEHIDELLHQHSLTNDRYFIGDAASLYANVGEALGALRSAQELTYGATSRAVRQKVLLIIGRAGVGKTHLFCDVAARRVRDGHPTVLLLGQEFDQRSLLPQIGESSGLGGTLHDVLAVLDAASEAAGCLGLFMIDALNESTDPERWPDDVRALAAATARYPHIALVLSCRTEFVPTVLAKHTFAAVSHVGFAEATDVAVNRFARAFGLEPPTFPVLNPEFSNPLYLKLTCESLTTLGAQRFSFGAAGLTTVSAAFLEAVNKRLSAAGRCDYDERSNPVATVVQQLAQLGSALMDREEVRRITEDALPRPTWSRSLMRGLIAEGVLLEVGNDRIAFGYQRLGDVARANAIGDEKTPDALRSWLRSCFAAHDRLVAFGALSGRRSAQRRLLV